jgi:hypothetical protein
VSRLSTAPRRHDPYWDMDGAGARRVRTKQRFVRLAIWVAIVALFAFVATRLPSLDPEYLFHGGGRPILTGALLTLLGAAALLALARVRRVSRN